MVKDDLSPTFELLILSLQKMCHMKLDRKIKIEALESATSDGHKPSLIGHIITTPQEILAKGNGFEWDLRDPTKEKSKSYKNSGVLIFDEFTIMVNTTQGVMNCDKSNLFDSHTGCRLKIQMVAKNIDKMDTFGKSDPYCIFELADGHGKTKTFKEIHRTEIIQHTLNPQFKAFVKTVSDFCDRDYDRRIRVKMFVKHAQKSRFFRPVFVR